MIDLHDVRENPDRYKRACERKRIKLSIDEFLALDKAQREEKQRIEALRAKQNAVSKEIPKLAGDEKAKRLAEMKELVAQLKDAEAPFKELEEKWEKMQLLIPSVPLDKVPDGKDDSENVEIKRWGDVPSFPFKFKSHMELGALHDIIDVERGVKVAGARSYFLKGDGALLAHAVMQFAISMLTKKGYTLMEPPHIVNYKAMMGTGYFPGGEEMAYHLDERDNDFFLIGTSEVSVCAYHMDETFELSELPKRYAGYSPCYRREAGTYGKDTAGIYRVHQFYKVEQVVVCRADAAESEKFHAELLGNAEELLQKIGLPYRVVDVCAGDMGQGQVYKNDIETWMPSRNAYGETHSCSTLHEFQARRLGMKYKDEEGKRRFCHTLNNTCAASTRLVLAILENFQNADGSITIPEVLRPFMGGKAQIGG